MLGIGTLVDTNDTDISAIPSENGKTIVSETANFDTQTQNEPVQRIDANIFKTPVKSKHFLLTITDFINPFWLVKLFLPSLDYYRNEKSFEDPISYQKILNSIKVNDIQNCQHLLDGCKVRKEVKNLD